MGVNKKKCTLFKNAKKGGLQKKISYSGTSKSLYKTGLYMSYLH